jgi:ABC-type glucose/galactose transport system permease subunit
MVEPVELLPRLPAIQNMPVVRVGQGIIRMIVAAAAAARLVQAGSEERVGRQRQPSVVLAEPVIMALAERVGRMFLVIMEILVDTVFMAVAAEEEGITENMVALAGFMEVEPVGVKQADMALAVKVFVY